VSKIKRNKSWKRTREKQTLTSHNTRNVENYIKPTTGQEIFPIKKKSRSRD
jgi:hypothetical protein